MTHSEVLVELQAVFVQVFNDDEVKVEDGTTANDIEDWDSLAHLQLISVIEKKFYIHFSLGEINSFSNVGEMCDCIVKHLK